MTEETQQYVMRDGQLCRVTQSYEPVDVAQLEAKVQEDNAHLENRQRELTELEAAKASTIARFDEQLETKNAEIGEAERNAESSKRLLSAAQTVVGQPSDEDGTDGAGSEVNYSGAEFLAGV